MRCVKYLTIILAALLVASIDCTVSELRVTPGEEVSIPVTVKNDEKDERTISLSYYFWGEGVEGYFYYQDKRVGSLRLNASEEAELSFKFIAPEKEGYYYLSLYGDGSTGIRVVVERPEAPLRITPQLKGVIIEAGDIVDVPIEVSNILTSPVEVQLSCEAPEGWDCSYYDGDTEVYKITVEGTKDLTLRVDSDSAAEVGSYEVLLKFGSQEAKIEFFVKESHAGERGELRMRVVDKDGAGVPSAKIIVGNRTFYTSGDGKAVLEVNPGNYDIKIEKGGYFEKTVRNVKVKGGRTTDLGTIFLEKRAYYAEIALGSSRITATIGDVAVIRITVENRGYGEDTYALSVENIPPEFSYNFKEENLAISELSLEGGESRDLTLEIYVPPSAKVGEYEAKVVARGKYEAERNLTISVVGAISAEFSLEGGMYTVFASQGEELELKGEVLNNGKGTTLTNVKLELELPENWRGEVSPDLIPSIEPGMVESVKLRVKVPPDARPSEYRITVKVLADQVSVSDRITVVVKESGFATFVGLGLIAIAIITLLILVKKVGRR